MTLREALSFKLPSGKAMGEASPQDWTEAAQFYQAESEAAEALDPLTMTEEDRQRIQASLERGREFDDAIEVIKKAMGERGRPLE